MKLQLAVTQHKLSGYTLVSPLNGDNPLNLELYVDNGEAEEIVCDNILEYVPIENLGIYLQNLTAKLAHGGKLIITSTDLDLVVQAYIRREINTLDVNQILYGQKTHAWDFKISCVNMFELTEVLKSLGLKIMEKRYHKYNYVVVGVRS